MDHPLNAVAFRLEAADMETAGFFSICSVKTPLKPSQYASARPKGRLTNLVEAPYYGL
jgi:hypothetical protein